jgi:hypothetical protein
VTKEPAPAVSQAAIREWAINFMMSAKASGNNGASDEADRVAIAFHDYGIVLVTGPERDGYIRFWHTGRP